MSQAWFGPKQIPHEFGIRTWQGWAVVAAYIVLMIGLHGFWLRAALTAGLLVLVWKKFETRSE